VHRYEGTVNQVLGDGIMALFGAPIAHEDHAVRACYAALAMQAAMRPYTDEMRRSRGLALRIRVGLHSGEVVVRAIGNDLHMDYSAVGETTHLAARMEQLATPGSICLTAETLRLAEGFIQVQSLGPVPVKGLVAPVEVFELVGASGIRRRLQAAAARGLTRFVGRQAELTALQQALARAEAGHGQVVALVGEAGVGKSRLVYECIRSHRTQGWLVLESSSVSYGKATAYLPVRDLLKAYCQIEERDEGRRIREKLTGKLLTLDDTLRPTLPVFLALLDVPVEDPTWQALDPPQRRQQTLEAMKRLLLRESQEQPLLLVFEDLHWIDTETQALLDSLVESLPTARLLLLVNYRPEYQHGWGSKTYYTQLRLDPLPPASADEFLQALLGDDPSLTPLKQLLIARTEGNPFFLEESVRALVEMGVLAGGPGSYRLVQPLQGLQVPATVQAVLAARIDRLPPEEKRLLQTAAVVGTEVPFALLQAIAEASEEALHRGLAHLQAAEFLYETSLFPEREYTFKHALTHEVAYSSLLHERRHVLHARIVEAVEALAGDRLDEQVERLAHHALRGEMWDKAVTYYRQAGTKARARSASREAVVCYEQALEALAHLPNSRATHEQAIDLRFEMRSALMRLVEYGRIFELMCAAEPLAQELDDPLRLGRIYAEMAACFRMRGEPDRAVAVGQRALALAARLEESSLQVQVNFTLGQVYYTVGDYWRAVEILTQNVTTLQAELLYERFGGLARPLASRGWLNFCRAELGAFTEGVASADEGLRMAEAFDPFTLGEACRGVGHLSLRQGEVHKAIPVLERAVSLCQDRDIPLIFPWVASFLGLVYTLAGRGAEGVSLLEQAVEQAVSKDRRAYMALWVALLGEAYLLTGRLEEAYTRAVQALELARTHQERGHEAWALRLLGEIAMHPEPPAVESAVAHYCQALALAEELGMRPLQAHCHLGLGTLYLKTDRPEQARAELTTAIDLYRAMDMTFWLPQAEAALAQVAF
jgi:tetratricopeptide (TPR) repeat protein